MRFSEKDIKQIIDTLIVAYLKHPVCPPICIHTQSVAMKNAFHDQLLEIRKALQKAGYLEGHKLVLGSDGLFFLEDKQAEKSLFPGWDARITIPLDRIPFVFETKEEG